jgi:type II secretory pathway predicted ATPase ExeA
VRHGIETRKGLIVIVGEAGSGKTLFLKSLVRDLATKAKTVIVQNPQADLDEMLRLLMERLQLQGTLDDRTTRLERLTEYLIEERSEGRIVCLFVDEAQDLEADTLDDLRLLANLEFEGDALLPLVLVGQPELNLKLDQPSAVRIKQRVALTRNIYPLIRKEVGPYIHTRLKVAGYERNTLFDAEAIDSIAAHSGGIPRMVNAICDNALMRAHSLQQRVISAQIVDQVARELRISAPLSLQKQSNRALIEPASPDRRESRRQHAKPQSVHFDLDEQEAGGLRQSSDFHVLGTSDPISGAATEMKRNAAPGARSMGVRWYVFAGSLVLLLLALNIVNSSQFAGLYSALTGITPTRPEPSALQPQTSEFPDEIKTERALNTRSTPDRIETKREPFDIATSNPANEMKANDAVGAANPLPAQPVEPSAPALESAGPQAQPAEPSSGKKNETKPVAVTLEVVARSKVRAKPNDESEIIAELEPGNRVTVLAKSRDYYHVRSVDDKTIRGYVHREDAFFESATRR